MADNHIYCLGIAVVSTFLAGMMFYVLPGGLQASWQRLSSLEFRLNESVKFEGLLRTEVQRVTGQRDGWQEKSEQQHLATSKLKCQFEASRLLAEELEDASRKQVQEISCLVAERDGLESVRNVLERIAEAGYLQRDILLSGVYAIASQEFQRLADKIDMADSVDLKLKFFDNLLGPQGRWGALFASGALQEYYQSWYAAQRERLAPLGVDSNYVVEVSEPLPDDYACSL